MRLSARKRAPAPAPHPDPVKELKLRSIAAIDGLRRQAARQTGIYLDEIVRTSSARRDAPYYFGTSGVMEMEPVFASRIARAEEGVRTQQELIISLSERLEKAVAESGLSDSDLAYLSLEES